MAAATSPGPAFSGWLKDYLGRLSGDIDADVFGEYIEGLLQDDTLEKDEILESISGFLESVIVSPITIPHYSPHFPRPPTPPLKEVKKSTLSFTKPKATPLVTPLSPPTHRQMARQHNSTI